MSKIYATSAQINTPNDSGQTPLEQAIVHVASAEDEVGIIRGLVALGANPGALSSDSLTLSSLASR